jgi:predicted neutral ceramidase superfamily lipid hydrolase
MRESTNLRLRMPAEHGAWGMLAVPFLTAAGVAGAWNAALLLCAVCLLSLFLLRGSVESQGGWKTLAAPAHLALAALAAATGSLLLLPYRRVELIPLAAAALVLYFAQIYLIRRHNRQRAAGANFSLPPSFEKRSLTAEMLGVVLLSMAAPAAWIASRGAMEKPALEVWALNLVFFAGGVLYVKYRVRGVQSHRKFSSLRERFLFAWPALLYHALLGAFLAATILKGAFPALVLLAFAPAILRATALVAQLGKRFPIRRLGWTEMVHAVVFATLLILAYR